MSASSIGRAAAWVFVGGLLAVTIGFALSQDAEPQREIRIGHGQVGVRARGQTVIGGLLPGPASPDVPPNSYKVSMDDDVYCLPDHVDTQVPIEGPMWRWIDETARHTLVGHDPQGPLPAALSTALQWRTTPQSAAWALRRLQAIVLDPYERYAKGPEKERHCTQPFYVDTVAQALQAPVSELAARHGDLYRRAAGNDVPVRWREFLAAVSKEVVKKKTVKDVGAELAGYDGNSALPESDVLRVH